MPEEGHIDQKTVMSSNKEALSRVQGLGNPVPAIFGSEQVGSQSSKSNDHNVSAVAHLAAESDNNTSIATTVANINLTKEKENPFLKGNRIFRSPPMSRTSSTGDINKIYSSPTTNTNVESEKNTLHAHLKSLEEVVSKLSNEITLLKKENEDLKRIIQSGNKNNIACGEYHTDEEELERETGTGPQ